MIEEIKALLVVTKRVVMGRIGIRGLIPLAIATKVVTKTEANPATTITTSADPETTPEMANNPRRRRELLPPKPDLKLADKERAQKTRMMAVGVQ